MNLKLMLKVALLALLALLASCAQAQNYPTKPITMVIPFSAGGPTDTLGRTIAQAVATALRQTVMIENAGGAGGNIGVDRVAKARPDGYTVLLHHIGMSTSPALYRKLNYNPHTDFGCIGSRLEQGTVAPARKWPQASVAVSSFPDRLSAADTARSTA